MATWTTYRLNPKPGAGFHFGLRGLEQEDSATYCPSDTLFAALVATAADLDGPQAAEAFAAPFAAGRLPFLLSSAFPIAGNLALLPPPHRRFELEEKRGQRKFLKKLRYVSPVVFKRILAGEPLDAYADPHGEGLFLQGGRVWVTRAEQAALPLEWRALKASELRQKKVWQTGAPDRVTVDRASSASSVFRIGRTIYAPHCGLWFGVQWTSGEDAATRLGLEELLAHLGDRGLGGERSVGYGQFKLGLDAPVMDLPAAQPGKAALSLSRYLPAPAELPEALRGRDASYKLAAIAGWLQAPGFAAKRRRQVRMLTEGSVFQTVGRGPWGRLADVRPANWTGHPIWRYGYACPVGVSTEEMQDA